MQALQTTATVLQEVTVTGGIDDIRLQALLTELATNVCDSHVQDVSGIARCTCGRPTAMPTL